MRDDNNTSNFNDPAEDGFVEISPNQRDDHPADGSVGQRDDHPTPRSDGPAKGIYEVIIEDDDDAECPSSPQPKPRATKRKSSKRRHIWIYNVIVIAIAIIINIIIWVKYPDGLTLFTSHSQSEDTTYTVTFDCNGGSDNIEPATVTKGSYVELPLIKRNYAINYNANGGQMSTISQKITVDCYGWSDNKDSFYGKYFCGSRYKVKSDITLYAIWPSEITISVTDEIPTRSGRSFLGWSTYEYATEATWSPNDELVISEDITLYAVWEAVAYTPGQITKGEYINEWAEIRIPVSNLDIISAGDSSIENNIESGFSFLVSDFSELDISFVHELPYGIETGEEFLKKHVTDLFNERSEMTIVEEVYDKTMIADQSYNSCLVAMKGENGNMAYVLFCARKIDNKLCLLRVVSESKEGLQDAVDIIKPY